MKLQKPIYKTCWFIVLVAFLIIASSGCNQDDSEGSKDRENEVLKETSEKEEDKKSEEEKQSKKDTIDTSVFIYAKSVNVTNAIDITEHVTVQIEAHEETNPGLAVQHILSQTFDFLQQEDLNGAKTVTIFVNHKNDKVMQITVNKDDFTPNDTDPMISLVLEASEIEKMTPEVKEHGKIMGTW